MDADWEFSSDIAPSTVATSGRVTRSLTRSTAGGGSDAMSLDVGLSEPDLA